MAARQPYPQDLISGWAEARNLPGWLIPLTVVMALVMVSGAAMICLRVLHCTVRAVPDSDLSAEVMTHALPSDARLTAAAWVIVRLIDDWRHDDLENRFATATPFIAPRIRSDIKDHFQSLLRQSTLDVLPAKAVTPIAAKIIARDVGSVQIALAYFAIDLVESSQGRLSVAHDEISVMVLKLDADAISDENPYGVLASSIDRMRGDEYKERFWNAGPPRRDTP